MRALDCPNCGAHLELDDSREYGFCSYCGAKVDLISSRVKVSGNVWIDRSQEILERARALEKLDRADEALEAYRELTDSYPSRWEGWWGIAVTTGDSREQADAWESFKKMADADVRTRQEPIYKLARKNLDLLDDMEAAQKNTEKLPRRIASTKRALEAHERVAPLYRRMRGCFYGLVACVILGALCLGAGCSLDMGNLVGVAFALFFIGVCLGLVMFGTSEAIEKRRVKVIKRKPSELRAQIARDKQVLAQSRQDYRDLSARQCELEQKIDALRWDLK